MSLVNIDISFLSGQSMEQNGANPCLLERSDFITRASPPGGIIDTTMSEGPIIPSEGSFFEKVSFRVKLIFRLVLDRRINPLLKVIPIGAVIYLISPFDIPAPVDDVAILWASAYFFIEMCPPEIVQEHIDRLESVVDGEFREVTDDDGSN